MRKIILISILILVLLLAGCETTPTQEVKKISEPTISAEQKVDEYLESPTQDSKVESPKEQEDKGYKELITLKGKGNSDTESFEITSSKVKIVAITESSIVGSYSSVKLQSEDGDDMLNAQLLVKGLSISGEAGKEGYGETIIRNLPDGKYYISVISGIGWEVTVYEYK